MNTVYQNKLLVQGEELNNYKNPEVSNEEIEKFKKELSGKNEKLKIVLDYLENDNLLTCYENINREDQKSNIHFGIAFSEITKLIGPIPMILDGKYDVKTNELKYRNKNALIHEFLHLCSTIYDKDNDIELSGFMQRNGNEEIGRALTEGYTELLFSRITGKNPTAYFEQVKFAKIFELFFNDKDKMQYYYTHHNLENFINSIAIKSKEEELINIINDMDKDKYKNKNSNQKNIQNRLCNYYIEKYSNNNEKLSELLNLISEEKLTVDKNVISKIYENIEKNSKITYQTIIENYNKINNLIPKEALTREEKKELAKLELLNEFGINKEKLNKFIDRMNPNDLRIGKYNLKNLNIKKFENSISLNIKDKHYDGYKMIKSGYDGWYNIKNNSLTYKNSNVIFHEFMHCFSSIFNQEENIMASGFMMKDTNTEIGRGLSEGYTELLTYRNKKIDIFKILSGYKNQMELAEAIESTFDHPIDMEHLYFNCNLPEVIAHLEKYATKEEIIEMIQKIDKVTLNKPLKDEIKIQLCYWEPDKVIDLMSRKQLKELIKFLESKSRNLILEMEEVIENKIEEKELTELIKKIKQQDSRLSRKNQIVYADQIITFRKQLQFEVKWQKEIIKDFEEIKNKLKEPKKEIESTEEIKENTKIEKNKFFGIYGETTEELINQLQTPEMADALNQFAKQLITRDKRQMMLIGFIDMLEDNNTFDIETDEKVKKLK